MTPEQEAALLAAHPEINSLTDALDREWAAVQLKAQIMDGREALAHVRSQARSHQISNINDKGATPMSPDVFLSRNGVKYDGSGLQGSPAQIVEALTELNSTRTWDTDTKDFVYTTYSSPDFTPGAPNNPSSFSWRKIKAENEAVVAYYAAALSGNLSAAHAAVDKINKIREQKGGAEFVPQPDFEILGSGTNNTAKAARWLTSDLRRTQEEDAPPPWFFTKAACDALIDYEDKRGH